MNELLQEASYVEIEPEFSEVGKIDEKENIGFISKHKSLLSSFPTKGEVYIDRDQENKDVVVFQKKGDMKLLEKIYVNRIPTIRTWAAKNYYPGLTNSVEDLFEELSVVFVKAAQTYKKNRGSFNTCLFTYFDNRIKNIKSGMHAKKRVSENYDGPRSSMVLSLDYTYGEGDGGGELTLKDIIPCPNPTEKEYLFNDMISSLSGGNDIVKEFLYKIGNGESISNLIKESKIKKGFVKLDEKTVSVIKKRKNKKFAKQLIDDKNKFVSNFKVVDYVINGNKLQYTIELSKTHEFETISRAVKALKKNKKSILSSIKN